MITKEDIKRLNEIRAEKRRLDNLDKELTAKLIADSEGETEKHWKGLSYKITSGKNTSARNSCSPSRTLMTVSGT